MKYKYNWTYGKVLSFVKLRYMDGPFNLKQVRIHFNVKNDYKMITKDYKNKKKEFSTWGEFFQSDACWCHVHQEGFYLSDSPFFFNTSTCDDQDK